MLPRQTNIVTIPNDRFYIEQNKQTKNECRDIIANMISLRINNQ